MKRKDFIKAGNPDKLKETERLLAVKKKYLKILNNRIKVYETEQSKLLLEFQKNIKTYLQKANRLSKNYRVHSERRKALKTILKEYRNQLNRDQSLNLYLILKMILKTPFKNTGL